jgi:hypothetical protein
MRILLLFAVVLLGPAAAHSQAPTMAQVIRALEEHPRQIRSVRTEFRIDQLLGEEFYRANQVSREDNQPSQALLVAWAFEADKSYSRTVNVDAGGKETVGGSGGSTIVYDGRREYQFKRTGGPAGTGTYVTINTRRPAGYLSPMSFGYWSGRGWIVDELKAGAAEIGGSVQDPVFGPLQEVRLKNRGVVKRFWLAPRHNYLAIRIEKLPHSPTEGVRTLFECTRVEKRGSAYFPVEGAYHSWQVRRGGQALLVKKNLVTRSWSLNDVDPALFTPAIPAGAVVWDADASTKYSVSASGQKVVDERTSLRPIDLPARWLFIVSLATLLFLGVSLVFRWRQRRVQL